MRCETRSGWRTAYAIETAQPWEIPNSANRVSPAASTTVSRSLTKASNEMSSTVRSRQPVAASIVADQRVVLRQLPVEVPPDRALEIEFQMRQPVSRLHQRRPLAELGIGELDPIGRGAEADVLLEVDGIGRRHAGTGRPVRRRDRED